MTAKIISSSTQKGGGGKTDRAFNTAGAFYSMFKNTLSLNKKICVLDVDPQHTASDLWRLNKNPLFPVIKFDETPEMSLQQKITEIINDYDYIFIDCPPTAENDISKNNIAKLVKVAYFLSDLVIAPVPLTMADILASVKTQTLLKEILQVNKNLKVRILINKYKKNSAITKQLEPVLRKKAMFPIFNTTISDRVSHIKANNWGKSVFETSVLDNVAIREEKLLLDEIMKVLES